MDDKKARQALKEIVDRCGQGSISKDRSAIKAALLDMLGGSSFKEECMVFKHAMDSEIFWNLLWDEPLSEKNIQNAVERLASESHMAKEDACFVMACIAVARGINPDIIKQKNDTYSDTKKGVQEGSYQNITSSDKTAQNVAGDKSRENAQAFNKPNAEKISDQDIGEQLSKGNSEKAVQSNAQNKDSPLLVAECKIKCSWLKIKQSKGRVSFYKGWLSFEPDDKDVYGVKNDAVEISYGDIRLFGLAYYIAVAYAYAIIFSMFVSAIMVGGILGVFCVILGIVSACLMYMVSKQIKIIKNGFGFKNSCFFVFRKKSDRKKALSILKTWTS